MARILIVGPGYVGGLLGKELIRRGHIVWALKRTEGTLPEGLIPIIGNVAAPEICEEIPEELDLIFYSAAPSSGEEASYQEVYVDGLANLLKLIETRKDPIRRFLLTSSTGVYHQNDGAWVDENSPTQPSRLTASHILQGEAMLQASSLETVSLRLAGIYGPGRNRLIRTVADRSAVCARGQRHFTNRIHQEDCVGALLHLMHVENPLDTYLCSDHDPAERSDVLGWIASQLGVPSPAQVDIDQAPSRLRGANKRCKNHRLVQSGYQFKYPGFRDGYPAIIRSWQETT